MMLKYAIALAIVLIVAAFFARAFLPARHLPGHRARHLRIRLHLRLHPGKGFAHVFSLWLRWGRLAALRHSARIRRSLPLWYRICDARQHSVFLGRGHYRHRLQVPLEEHLLIMAPPRTYKTAFLADVILRFPGPVIATTTKADIYGLTSAVRAQFGPVHVFNPQHIGGVPATFRWSPVTGCQDPASGPSAPRTSSPSRVAPARCRYLISSGPPRNRACPLPGTRLGQAARALRAVVLASCGCGPVARARRRRVSGGFVSRPACRVRRGRGGRRRTSVLLGWLGWAGVRTGPVLPWAVFSPSG